MAPLQALAVTFIVIVRFSSTHLANTTQGHKCKVRVKRFKLINPMAAKPSVTQRAMIFGRFGFALYINSSGELGGTSNVTDKNTLFDIMSFGKGIVALKNVQTGKYIAMSRRGRFKGKVRLDRKCLFAQTMMENHWINYASHKYYMKKDHDMFLGIQKRGHLKPACKTKYGQIAIQFQVVKNFKAPLDRI